jgi:CO dehydrogenase maturation factor
MPIDISHKRLVAVCGKGGSGKTALSALMTKYILQSSEKQLLVIDADPTMNLAPVLGVKVKKTVSDIRKNIIKIARSAGKMEKQDLAYSFDYMLLEALIETDCLTMLAMGRPDSAGCYCPVNDLLRDGIESLAGNFDIILIDGEAGLEQISRRVMRSVDTPIIVSDTSMRGFQTASLIKKAIESQDEIEYQHIGLVLNRVRCNEDLFQGQIDKTGLELFGIIPEDELITHFDMRAKPLLDLPNDSPAFNAAIDIFSKIDMVAG